MLIRRYIVLFLAVVLQSCAFYKFGWHTVPFDKSINKSPVKVLTETGSEFVFQKIVSKNGNYFGLRPNSLDSFRIYEESISKVFVKGLLLEEAVEGGRVKIKYKANPSQRFNNIAVRDSSYFGIPWGRLNKQVVIKEEWKIETENISGIYPYNKGASSIATTALVLAPITAAAVIITTCNCPYVEVLDENGTEQFQGTLFPGAIFKSLERTDYLVLNIEPKSDTIHVRILNELPEREFINNIRLKKYNLEKNERPAISSTGNLIAVSNFISPLSLKSQNEKNWKSVIQYEDGLTYKFDDSRDREEFNSLELKFPLDKSSDTLNLYIHAKQTEWLETVAESLFPLVGNKLEKLTAIKDHADPDRYSRKAIEKGISLRVLAKVKEEWKLIGAFQNAGTKSFRNLTITLPSNLNYGTELNIRLESAYRFLGSRPNCDGFKS